MAFTKVTHAGIGSTGTVLLQNLDVIGIVTAGFGVSTVDVFTTGITTFFNGTDSTSTTTGSVIVKGGVGIAGSLNVGGSVSVGGTLTYEDVTNIDSVGIITARSDILVGSGITLSPDGDGFFTGVVTATTFSGAFSGDGSALTGVANTDVIFTDKLGLGDGTATSGDQINIGVGSDFKLYHNGSHSFIDNNTGDLNVESTNIYIKANNTENAIDCVANGAVNLYHNNAKKVSTHSNGLTIKNEAGGSSSSLFIFGPEGESAEIQMNADDGDDNADYYRLIHVASDNSWRLQNYAGGGWETNIEANGNGNVELYYDGSKKLETASGGVTVTGTVAATSYTGDGSSLTGIAAGITTEAASISGITTYLDLTKDDHELVVTGTNTISVIVGAQGTSHTLRLQNSGIATVTLDSTYFKFASGASPAFPTASGSISLVSFTVHKAGAVGVNTVLLTGASVSFS